MFVDLINVKICFLRNIEESSFRDIKISMFKLFKEIN